MNLKKIILVLNISMTLMSLAQTPMVPMTLETIDRYRHIDMNFNGVLEIEEVEMFGGYGNVNYKDLKGDLDYYDESTMFELLKEDITSLSYPNSIYKVLDSVPYSDFKRINDFGYWDEIHVILEKNDTLINIDGINDDYDRIKWLYLHPYGVTQLQKLTLSRIEQFTIAPIIAKIDSIEILELERIDIENIRNGYLDIQNFSGRLDFDNYTGVEYLDLSHTSTNSIYISNTSEIKFICVPSGFDSNYFYNLSSNIIGFSDSCSLADPTNQVADVNTKLANALINATPSIDFNGDNIIQGWELVRADSIIIPSADIDSLDGIHLATNLVYLDVSDNNLDTIQLENFLKLEYLNISGNSISSIDFGGELVSDEDVFDEVPPTTTPGSALDTLIAYNNTLTSLDVSELSLSYLSTINNSSLDYICVSSDQMVNDTPNWDKDLSSEYSIGCSIISSSNELNHKTNIIYPNPATDFIRFSDGLVSISNIEGKVIFENNNETSIDISQLTIGIYFANFDNGEIQKIIIK